ncbi:MAG: alpha/beta fold hydrolase [Micropruina sp.]|uniref:alpha/beta fold hydrolase n=1 Tax=Micropruina sp. TaxID=2737536 RepID=UPI0039E3ECA1
MSFADARTRTVVAAGAELVYRELGADNDGDGDGDGGVPLVGLTHLGANLDSWDPELVDPLAQDRRVILLGYRGVGASTGTVRDRFEDMAADAIAALGALGLSRVDLFGLSMGGMVAQEILRQAPGLAERVILAGTGPQGGPGLTAMTGVTLRTVLRAGVTFADPTTLLFFTLTPTGRRAATTYRARLTRRSTGRDKPVAPGVFRAQLEAVSRWGHQQQASSMFAGPVLIVHGDSDRMVPPANADALRERYPGAEVHVYTDSGHGVAFQNRHSVTDTATRFLRR